MNFRVWLGGDPDRCGASRTPRSTTRCELPVDHVVGRDHTPIKLSHHLGRSRRGHWFEWGFSEDGADGGDKGGKGEKKQSEGD